MKIIIFHVLAVFLLLGVGAKATAAKTYYFYVGYFAHTAPHEYQHIYEKKIIAIKAEDVDVPNVHDRLKEDYVAFIKKNHPEYYKGHIMGQSDPKYIEFKIRSQARVNGHWSRESDVRRAKEMDIMERKERFAKDAKNGSVIETDEYSYP